MMLDSVMTFAWFESWTIGISESVALAATATLGYLFGRRMGRLHPSPRPAHAEWELHRAASIARSLESIVAEVCDDLAAHHASVKEFKAKVDQMSNCGMDGSGKHVYEEAERVLAPTLKVAALLSNAYDRIRQQSAHLLTFTEGRTDPLTGAGNRRALDDQLNLLFEMLCRDGRPFSLIIFDIDRFAFINQEKGHAFGDQLLQDLARLLERSVRGSDFVARYGGEEFVVVMPQTRLAGARVFAERLRGQVEQNLGCTVSGGIAEATPEDTTVAVLSRADSALYSAKAAGRNAIFQHCGNAVLPVEQQDPKPVEKQDPNMDCSEEEPSTELNQDEVHGAPDSNGHCDPANLLERNGDTSGFDSSNAVRIVS